MSLGYRIFNIPCPRLCSKLTSDMETYVKVHDERSHTFRSQGLGYAIVLPPEWPIR